MITESNITLFSKGLDPLTRLDTWTKYHIYEVHWEEVQGLNIIKSGLKDADKVIVFIPLTSIDGVLSTRIKPDDYIVKGIVDDNILTTSDLERKYSTAVKVKTADYREDALNESLWHVEVGCG